MADIPNLAEVSVKVVLDTGQYDASEATLKARSRKLSETLSADMQKASKDVSSFSRESSRSNKAALDSMGINWRLYSKHVTETLRDQQRALKVVAQEEANLTRETYALKAAIDPTGAAMDRMNSALERLNRLRQKGKIDAEMHAKAILHEKQTYDLFVASQAKGSGLKAHQMTNLSFQANDVISGLMMGQNPAQIAAQQGGQIFQILQQSKGGVIAGLKDVGSAVGAFLINPVTLGITAVAALTAGLVALGARSMDTAKVIREFGGYVGVVAQDSGYLAEDLEASARALDVYGSSFKDAQAAVRTFVKEGVSKEFIGDFNELSVQMAKILGIEVPDAAKMASSGLTGTMKDVVALSQAAGGFTLEQLKMIKSLYDAGKAQEAQNLAFKIFSEVYGKEYNDTLTDADRLTLTLASSWDTLVSNMSNVQPIQDAARFIGDVAQQVGMVLQGLIAVKNLRLDQLSSEMTSASSEYRSAQADADAKAAALAAYDARNPKASPTNMDRMILVRRVNDARADQFKFGQRYNALADEYKAKSQTSVGNVSTPQSQGLEGFYRTYDDKAKKEKKGPRERESDAERATKRIMDETVALQEQAKVRASLDAAIAMGLVTREEANRQMEISNTLSKYEFELKNASKEDAPALQAALAAYRKELEAASKSGYVTTLEAQTEAMSKQNDMLAFEITLIGKSNAEKRAALAIEQKRRDLEAGGILKPGDPAYDAAMGEVARGEGLIKTGDILKWEEEQRKAAESQTRELDILRKTMWMTREEAERYRKEQELINEYTRAFGEPGDEALLIIRGMAQGYAETAEKMRDILDTQEAINSAAETLAGAIEDVVINGKSASEVFLQMAKALDVVIMKAILLGEGPLAGIMGTKDSGGWLGQLGKAAAGIFGGGTAEGAAGAAASGTASGAASSIGDAFGNIFAGMFHGGGIGGSPTQFRMDAPANWNGAPKFHSGMMPNRLAPNERRAIILDDEAVLTRKQQDSVISRMGGTTMVFNGVQDYDSIRRNERSVRNWAFRTMGRSVSRG